MYRFGMLAVATFSPTVAGLLTGGLLALGVGALAVRRRRLAGTTLLAVWNWALVSLAAIGGAELLAAISGATAAPWIQAVRFAAAVSSVCPMMALLGAKRPQDRGWQFIVLTLWIILSLPAAHWLLFGGVREIHPAQIGLLAILIGTGAINALATRQWLAGLLYSLGQMALLGSYLTSLEPWLSDERGPLLGLALVIASWLLLAVSSERSHATSGLDRVWLDFRNSFGAVWGLRVMERMNASSKMYGWPVTLTWQGFVPREEAVRMAESSPVIADSLRTLLRRFVSPEWIDVRLSDFAPLSPSPAVPLSASGAAP
jgi:hypothetical protein